MPGDDAVTELLADLDRRQVRLRVEGDRLRCAAPKGVLTETLVETIRARKAEIVNHLGGRETPPTASRHEPVPLSFTQEQVWLAQHLSSGDSAYNIPLAARLLGPVCVAGLRQAVAEVVRRHEVLRTSYPVRAGRPSQRVAPFDPPAVPIVDLSALAQAPMRATLATMTAAMARRPFDLACGPVIRTSLVRRSPRDHRLLMTRHHIASDGWSFSVLGAELSTHYGAFRFGRPSPSPPLPLQYADFAAGQRAGEQRAGGQRMGEQCMGEQRMGEQSAVDGGVSESVEVWRARLAGADWGLDLLSSAGRAGLERPPGGQNAAVRSESPPAQAVAVTMAPLVVDNLRLLARETTTTAFTVLATAFGLALTSAAGQDDVVIAVPTSGRTRRELDGLIGCFATLLPLRLSLTGASTLRQAIGLAHGAVTEALAHQDVPLERIVEVARAPRRHDGRGPCGASFTFQNTPRASVDLPGVTVELAEPATVAARFPLAVTVSGDDQGGLRVLAEFDADLLDAGAASGVLARFADLVERGCPEPDRPLIDLISRISPAPAPAGDAAGGDLASSFAAIAAAMPDAIAVCHEGTQISYGALRRRALALAAALRAQGVCAETPVGLVVEHGVDLAAAVVGITLAGGAYVPIDPTDPPARREALLADAGAQTLVTQRAHADEFAWFAGAVVCVDGDLDSGAVRAAVRLAPQALAYVIYTSGSTGVPKGVMVSHGSVVSMLAAAAGALDLSARDVWSLTHASAFDFSVWELWGPLLHGARLVVVSRDVARDPRRLWQLLTTEQVSVVSATPSAFQAILTCGEADRGSAARLVVLGGERCDPRTLGTWFDRHGDERPTLINMYGITETTVHVTCRRLNRADAAGAGSPIGTPLRGASLYALNGGVSVAVGGVGELVVGGTGVARGYLGRPGLTADRFRPDHLGLTPGARLYRSGDRGRALPHGEFAYVARGDQQLKVRGYRIEPGEIEAVLLGHPDVAAVAVGARHDGERAALVAYVVPAPRAHGARVSTRDLRRYLAQRLPTYLVPASYALLDALPLTRNGKLDIAALASMPLAGVEVADADRPRTETERTLAALWCELLGVGSVGIHEDFFDAGGDSLLVTRLHGRLPALFGVQLPMRRLYQSLDVASQAAAIDGLRGERGRLDDG